MEFKGTKNLVANGLNISETGKTGRVGQAFLMSFEYDRTGKSLPDTIGEANAKLWAASPELLEALQDIMQLVNVFGLSDEGIKRYNKGYDAITKALK